MADDTTYNGAVLAQAQSGDHEAFNTIAGQSRLPIFRHCYRMLGSAQEAEDAVQDTLLRAWQRLATFDGRGSFPGWMYRIATNVCIDRLRSRQRRTHPISLGPPATIGAPPRVSEADVKWVEPVADHRIGIGSDPEESALGRERISLAFVVALQRLSARQRAALLLHDVLDFTHEEVGEVLDASPSAINSLLYRARQAISTLPTTGNVDPGDPSVQFLLERYVRAWELADIAEFLATVTDDVRLSMPPLASWYQGATAVAAFIESAIFEMARPHGVAMRVGRANGQPALATYSLGRNGNLAVDGLQILDIDSDRMRISAITSFRDPDLAVRCGLPAALA